MHTKAKLYALILAAVFLAGCKGNASADAAKIAELQAQLAAVQQQQPTAPVTEMTAVNEQASDELPNVDQVPANNGQDDTAPQLPASLPKEDPKVVTFWEQYQRTNPEGKLFGYYPNMTQFHCTLIEPNGDPECTMNGRPVDITKQGLPYLLNSDVAVAGEWMQCGDDICIQGSTGVPIGRLQPKMAEWMMSSCNWADITTFKCSV